MCSFFTAFKFNFNLCGEVVFLSSNFAATFSCFGAEVSALERDTGVQEFNEGLPADESYPAIQSNGEVKTKGAGMVEQVEAGVRV